MHEFEQYLEEKIGREINYISWVSLISGRLQREIAAIPNSFPDSTRLTDFASEACERPLVHQFKHGEEATTSSAARAAWTTA